MSSWGTDKCRDLVFSELALRPSVEEYAHTYLGTILQGISKRKLNESNKRSYSRTKLPTLFLRLWIKNYIHREIDYRMQEAQSGPKIQATTSIISWRRHSQTCTFKFNLISSARIGNTKLLSNHFRNNRIMFCVIYTCSRNRPSKPKCTQACCCWQTPSPSNKPSMPPMNSKAESPGYNLGHRLPRL